jgi:hypothetical protein
MEIKSGVNGTYSTHEADEEFKCTGSSGTDWRRMVKWILRKLGVRNVEV